MQFKNIIAAALAGSAAAQNMSLCDKYTTALLMNNTAANQYTVLTLLVNTVVIGNFSFKGFGNKNAVAGILANGTYGGEHVSLLPYFNGKFISTNRNNMAVSVNFLDDGGATPLTMGKPANGTSSNQYKLLTHLYQFFGALLGCSGYGSMGFPSYQGQPSQYTVHKFMALDANQVGYFIEQVGLAATSFGVSSADAMAVGTTLGGAFNYACIAPAALLPNSTAVLNSICDATSCPQAPSPDCSAYDTTNSNGTEVMPKLGNGTTSGTATGTSTGAGSTTTNNGAAALTVPAVGLGALLLAAFAL